MNSGLKNKVVIVTGASGGIGSAIARQFAAEGARLILHYRENRRSADTLRKELKHNESIAIRADLTAEAEVKKLFAAASPAFWPRR